MFVLKDKLVKLTMGFMVTSFLTFATAMPVSAADFQPNVDSNAGIAVQEEVQQDSLCPYNSDLKDQATAQITIMENGKSREILVKPRSNLSAQTAIGQNVALEASATSSEEQVVDGEVTATTCEQQPVDVEEETPAPVDEEEAVDVVEEETPAPVDEESVEDRLYTELLNSYNRLLSIYEQLLDFFGVVVTN